MLDTPKDEKIQEMEVPRKLNQPYVQVSNLKLFSLNDLALFIFIRSNDFQIFSFSLWQYPVLTKYGILFCFVGFPVPFLINLFCLVCWFDRRSDGRAEGTQ